jgi:glycerol-3-phosphate dehydrogenase
MERDLHKMAQQPYDLLVIGGGIYGVCVAWDAVLRGLRVALVEQADFGQATSANSLKTLHGGLRYLQEANLPLMRLMIRERSSWLRMAPHLVRPLPFLLPTGGKLAHHKLLMRAALTVNDVVSWDRNRGVTPELHLPHGRILSRAECLDYLPGLCDRPVSGGALWYDAQLLDTEQLLLTILQAAMARGVCAANYAAVSGFVQAGRRVQGVIVTDRLSGERYAVEAGLVINCAGAWSDELLALVDGGISTPTFRLSTAVNLVTRQIIRDVAVGLPSRWQGRSRILFVAPWQDSSLVGTWHAPYAGRTPHYEVDEATIAGCLDEINAAYPPAQLTRQDVRQVHAGYLPMEPGAGAGVKLVRESLIYDHARTDKLDGLVSVAGVKYTTARHTAEQVVDLALHKLGRPAAPCSTAYTQIAPGDFIVAGLGVTP